MLGLCSTIICHRFSSPAWWKYLQRLIATGDPEGKHGFDIISELQTGEAVLFSPLARVTRSDGKGEVKIRKIGRGYLIVKVRRKLTAVTGLSVLSQNI